LVELVAIASVGALIAELHPHLADIHAVRDRDIRGTAVFDVSCGSVSSS